MKFLLPLLICLSAGAQERDPAAAAPFLQARGLEPDRHVLLMHVDGFQTRIFQAMLANGQVPNFKFLIENGASTSAAATVDKSETMKVIPAVMSSKVDTRLTAWWQFDRQTLSFRNFWIEPVEVVNYALGMDFPLYPTLIDVVAKGGHADRDIVAGFSLYRRGVPAQNYSRIYVEGYDSVSSHRYYRQAYATTTELIELLHQHASTGTYPKLILSLIAPIDEMIHLNGLTKTGEKRAEYCFTRSNGKPVLPPDDVMDELATNKDPGVSRSFTKIRWVGFLHHRVDEICIKAPSIQLKHEDGTTTAEKVYPEVALAFVAADMNVGRLIQGLREIHIEKDHASIQWADFGIQKYMKNARLESSAFEKTLFLIYGDHGMTNTFHLMNKPIGYEAERVNRSKQSYPYPFSQVLADTFHLKAYVDNKWVGPGDKLVIDYANLPPDLANPASVGAWQTPPVKNVVGKATTEASTLFHELIATVRDAAYHKYWFLGPLRKYIVDPKINDASKAARSMAEGLLRSTVLRGNPAYNSASRAHDLDYLNEHVGLIYGGGALNNAEFFIPHQVAGKSDWSIRPSQTEVMNSFGGKFLEILRKTPGVGLIYSRRENDKIVADTSVPDVLHIDVYDNDLNHGLITVQRDANSHQQIFHYKTVTAKDPLQYEALGSVQGRWGTYQEWNDLSIQNHTFYENAVAGVASYLATSSSAIGDVLAMHAPGWNFGENLGGHGGIEADEKLMSVIAFGPGVRARTQLTSSCAYSTEAGGAVARKTATHTPTILDVSPTALAHLGYAVHDGEGELTRFSRAGFGAYLSSWRTSQLKTCAEQGYLVIDSQLSKLGYSIPKSSTSRTLSVIRELCHALETEAMPKLPDYQHTKEDGCLLDMSSTARAN